MWKRRIKKSYEKSKFNFFQFTLSYNESIHFIRNLGSFSNKFSYNKIKNEFSFFEIDKKIQIYLKLPVLFYLLFNIHNDLSKYVTTFSDDIPSYLILIIRAGYAALGLTNQGQFISHKVIKKYMVRKKQGKAQITYLAQKGKARGGAQLRLVRTREFFEEITVRLNEWSDNISIIDWIFFQSSLRLWNELFNNRIINLPFNKNDERIKKIPFTTYKPTFKELRRINYNLQNGNVAIYSSNDFKDLNDILIFLNSL